MKKDRINNLFTHIENILELNDKTINNISHIIENQITHEKRIIFVAVGMTASTIKAIISETYRYKINSDLFIVVEGTKTYKDAFDNPHFLEEVHSVAIFELDSLKITNDDFVIGLSVTGKTKYVFSALSYAKNLGCKTALISPFNTKEDPSITKIDYVVDSELDSSETSITIDYLNSTTVLKMVIESIFIKSMEHLGRIYKGIIVNTNVEFEKMSFAVEEWLIEVQGITKTKARNIMDASRNSLPHIIIMSELGITYNKADKLLEEYKGNIDKAIKISKGS